MKIVTIYSTPMCHFCQAAKAFLTEHSIPFTNYDVASDRAKAQEMMQKSGQMAVPVIFVDETMVIGFDQPQLSKLLGIA